MFITFIKNANCPNSFSLDGHPSFWLFFPLYNDKNMSMLIEDKTVSDTRSFSRHLSHNIIILVY